METVLEYLITRRAKDLYDEEVLFPIRYDPVDYTGRWRIINEGDRTILELECVYLYYEDRVTMVESPWSRVRTRFLGLPWKKEHRRVLRAKVFWAHEKSLRLRIVHTNMCDSCAGSEGIKEQ
jgi:hypothetical protein